MNTSFKFLFLVILKSNNFPSASEFAFLFFSFDGLSFKVLIKYIEVCGFNVIKCGKIPEEVRILMRCSASEGNAKYSHKDKEDGGFELHG